MGRPKQTVRVRCGHEGCAEWTFYEAYNRAHAADLGRRYGGGRWLCVRHSQPNEVLSAENLKTVREAVAAPIHGRLYWSGGSASAFGPGFKAFAGDFPPGTVLRVTAEIILPTHEDTP